MTNSKEYFMYHLERAKPLRSHYQNQVPQLTWIIYCKPMLLIMHMHYMLTVHLCPSFKTVTWKQSQAKIQHPLPKTRWCSWLIRWSLHVIIHRCFQYTLKRNDNRLENTCIFLSFLLTHLQKVKFLVLIVCTQSTWQSLSLIWVTARRETQRH